MQTADIIDAIAAKRLSMGLTIQQLSDLSGVPKATVDKVLRKETQNPSMQTVLDLASAVGYDHARQGNDNPLDDPTVKHIIAMHNKQDAEKNRRLQTLSLVIMTLAMTLFMVLAAVAWVWHYDFTHLGKGWITDESALLTESCVYCSRAIDEDNIFCPHCGTKQME